jgi:hypothetical protein
MSTSTSETTLPAKLVLEFTTLYQPCSGSVGKQIQQGKTFSVPFDLSQVKNQGGNWNGYAYVTTDPENNFQATSKIQLSAMGLAGKPAFMSASPAATTIFGQPETVAPVSIVGTPSGSGFTWSAAVRVGGCMVTNGAHASDLAAKLDQES